MYSAIKEHQFYEVATNVRFRYSIYSSYVKFFLLTIGAGACMDVLCGVMEAIEAGDDCRRLTSRTRPIYTNLFFSNGIFVDDSGSENFFKVTKTDASAKEDAGDGTGVKLTVCFKANFTDSASESGNSD
jgi:hypothetical protein